MKSARTRRGRRRPHSLLLLICVTLSLSLSGGVASAFWTSGSMTRGNAMATAATVGAVQPPAVTAVGGQVTVSWTSPAAGAPVSGYTVNRYATASRTTGVTVCTVAAAGSCVDAGRPDGVWFYTVTPRTGGKWLGAESGSTSVTVDVTAPTVGPFTGLVANHLAGTITMTLGAASDNGSGIKTRQVQRWTAPHKAAKVGEGGTCGVFEALEDPVNIAELVDSPELAIDYDDSPNSYGSCFQYEYIVTDFAGNTARVKSDSIMWIGYADTVWETPGLLSHWRLGDSPTSTLTDSAGQRPGSYFNTSVAVDSVVTGNGAATFNGTDSEAVIPGLVTPSSGGNRPDSGSKPDQTPITTIELWLKTEVNTNTKDQVILSSSRLELILDKDGQSLNLNGTNFRASGPLGDENWKHVVLTFVDNSATIYFDGVFAGTKNMSNNSKISVMGDDLTIGAAIKGEPKHFTGSIDEVSIYSTGLTCSTIRAHYAFGPASTTTFATVCP